jgi:exodeoxyribonuclease VII large subunit
MEKVRLSVSDFIALTNQTLEYSYPSIEVEGEVSSYKVNQGKFVFFDLKDAGGTVGCFMTVWQLRIPIEDGMKVIVTATPKLTQWGKFSLTVRAIRPSGEGALKKSFELLRAKLDAEGLFAEDRKRAIPATPSYIGVISSTQAAGYIDFTKILNDRWGGVNVETAHVQVQGEKAPDQIIRALKFFNEKEQTPEVIVILRGGGSADDLAAFNDEPLVRAIASSRVPVMTAIGHEVDVSLADLAADVRASTPSNAAQLLVPDREEMRREVMAKTRGLAVRVEREVVEYRRLLRVKLGESLQTIELAADQSTRTLAQLQRVLATSNPETVLKKGYAIVRGTQKVGEVVELETMTSIMKARIEK